MTDLADMIERLEERRELRFDILTVSFDPSGALFDMDNDGWVLHTHLGAPDVERLRDALSRWLAVNDIREGRIAVSFLEGGGVAMTRADPR